MAVNVAVEQAMVDPMQPVLGGDADPGVVRAVPRGGRGQHDAGDDEEDDAGDSSGTENQRGHECRRRHEEGPNTAI